MTTEVNPSKFLDMEIMIKNGGIIETSVIVYSITGHQQSPKSIEESNSRIFT